MLARAAQVAMRRASWGQSSMTQRAAPTSVASASWTRRPARPPTSHVFCGPSKRWRRASVAATLCGIVRREKWRAGPSARPSRTAGARARARGSARARARAKANSCGGRQASAAMRHRSRQTQLTERTRSSRVPLTGHLRPVCAPSRLSCRSPRSVRRSAGLRARGSWWPVSAACMPSGGSTRSRLRAWRCTFCRRWPNTLTGGRRG
mmetsp:Transcript_67313/g.194932  ORF Transcript_67313/g.194932 Transcript_67313/m.194932 type:complete len:207 (-) Transcript_67313:21-641(-)